MAKAKFVGDRNNPKEAIPDEIEVYGILFKKGKFSEIPDNLTGKFDGNSHFELQEDDAEPRDGPQNAQPEDKSAK